jgi:hypothetical protein
VFLDQLDHPVHRDQQARRELAVLLAHLDQLALLARPDLKEIQAGQLGQLDLLGQLA